MAIRRGKFRVSVQAGVLLTSLGLALLPANFSAQTPRFELVAQLNHWRPNGAIAGTTFRRINYGASFSAAYFINQRIGVQAEGDFHPQTANDGNRGFVGGPVVRFPVLGAVLHLHALAGATQLTGPNVPSLGGAGYFYNACQWGPMMAVGGGLDVPISGTRGRLAFRVLQADFQRHTVDFGAQTSTGGGLARLYALQLGSGLVFRFGKP